MERYTYGQMEHAVAGYHERTNRVEEVLRLAPQLSATGIERVIHVSSDFLLPTDIRQWFERGFGGGTIEDVCFVFRELVLNHNPNMAVDAPLLDCFVRTPLEVETGPFFMVAYDEPALAYAREHATERQELPKAWLMQTKSGVPFYLTDEAQINEKFIRVRLQEDLAILVPTPPRPRKR